jgi:hypothetical protein
MFLSNMIMKNLYRLSLVSFLLVFTISASFAQVYKPFPTSGATWREYQNGYQCDCCSDYQLFINGDTVINTMTYHKLRKTGMMYFEDLNGNCHPIFWYNINQYAGGFRNDSINKRVYYFPPYALNETLLYDFNLNLGDTTVTYLSEFIGESWVVTNVDSVLIGNEYHRRLQLNDCLDKPLHIIEGVGSTFGLLSPFICWEPWYEHVSNLMCFKQDNQTVYPDPNIDCQLVSSVNQIDDFNQDVHVSIFPNPSNDNLSITSSLMDFHICIINESGQLLYKKKVDSNSTQIDISTWKNGQYFIELSKNGNSLFRQSFIR